MVPRLLLLLGLLTLLWLWLLDRWLKRQSGLRSLQWLDIHLCALEGLNRHRPAFFATGHVPWCRLLRRNWRAIDRELGRHIASGPLPVLGDVMPEFRMLSNSGGRLHSRWRMGLLRMAGMDTALMAHFPCTRQLLRHVPGCTFAMFSVLEPGKKLLTHTGPNHSVLRYLLALRVPDRRHATCSLTVQGAAAPHVWERPGQDVLFDDTLPHSTEYRVTDDAVDLGSRIVLFLDVPRPLHRLPARLLRWYLYHGLLPHHPNLREIFDDVQTTTTDAANLLAQLSS